MEFVLTGFSQEINVRRYTFDAIGADRSRKQVSVGADLGLIRQYKIPLQELPLLCRRLLEGNLDAKTLMFTEKDMVGYANDRAAAQEVADQKRRAHRMAASAKVGQAWRTR
jgi:hypothetical protein